MNMNFWTFTFVSYKGLKVLIKTKQMDQLRKTINASKFIY